MKALDRLSFAGKFALLGLLAVGLIAVPTTLYVLAALESGRQTNQELRGIAPVQQLLRAVELTQRHRDLASAVLGGEGDLKTARQDAQAELERAFKASEQALLAAQVEPDLLSAWSKVREQWNALSKEVGQGTLQARQSLQRHSQLISSSLLIEDALLDHFELALDPVLETYSLMSAVLIQMPQTAELFGQLRGFGALYLVQGRILPEQQGALMGLTAQALASLERMERAFAKASDANPAIAAVLEEPLAALRPQIQQALALTDTQLISALQMDISDDAGSGGSGSAAYGLQVNYPVANYLAAYDRATDALRALGGVAQTALEKGLAARHDSNQHNLLLICSGLLMLLLVGGGLAALIVVRLLGQLGIAIGAAERIARGDLSERLQTDGSDEAARLLQALDRMQGDLRGTVCQVVTSAEQLASASAALSEVTAEASTGLQRQSSELDQAASAVTELTSAVEEVARNAASASEVSHSADQCSQQGRQSVSRTADAIEALSSDIQETAGALQVLAGRIGEIGGVLEVIRGVAEQTNLLALNAAIEAARAGDSGRGFAVVADEVRALAQRTGDSTRQIEAIIGAVQQSSQEALRSMCGSESRTHETLELARTAGAALDAIVEAIAQINERNLCIASATEQQSQVAREVDRNLLNIRDVALQASGGAALTQSSSRELAALAADLRGMVGRFKV